MCDPRGASGCGHHAYPVSRGHAVVVSGRTPVLPSCGLPAPPSEHMGVWGHSQGGKSASSPRASLLAVGGGGVSRLRPRVLRVASPSPGEQAVHTTRVWLEYRFGSNVQPSFLRPVVLRITDTLRRQRKVRAGGAGGGFGRRPARSTPRASLRWSEMGAEHVSADGTLCLLALGLFGLLTQRPAARAP